MGKLWSLGLLCAVALLPPSLSAQQLDYPTRMQLKAEVSALADPDAETTLAADAASLMAKVGLSWDQSLAPERPVPEFMTSAGAVVELVDIRLLLTQIAIQTGARDHVALVRAQGDRDHDVILLRGGFARFGDLLALAKGTRAQDFITLDAGRLRLTRPLAIWSDAGLTLEANNHLILDRASGSFIANLGRLDVSSGKISGSKSDNIAEPAFRPFVITAGQGSFTAKYASFQDLGFDSATVFGGISIANNGLVPSRMPSVLISSVLLDVGTVGLIGTTDAVVSGNRINAARGTAILISASQDATIALNHISVVTGGQTIRVTAGSSWVRIDRNLLSGSARTGILIDRKSDDVFVFNNLVMGSEATGVSVATAACAQIIGNLVAANRGAGITLSNVETAQVRSNAILFNRGAGIIVRDQQESARIRITENVFIGNREGLRGATPGTLELSANNLDGQIPRLFAGDLSQLTIDWLRNRKVAIAVSQDPVRFADTCAMVGER